MATLWIREYSHTARPRSGGAGAGASREPASLAHEPGTDQTPVTFTTSVASAAFASGTAYITMTSDAAFHYVVGATPVATTGAMRVPANTLVSFGVTAGHKIAAIAAA